MHVQRFTRVRASYLSESGRGNPSRSHLMLGVGFPLAEHFRETKGPGWRVWSMNV